MRHHLIISPVKKRPLSKSQEISIGEDVRGIKALCPTIGELVHYGGQYGSSLKLKTELSYDPENPPPGIYPRKQKQDLKNTCTPVFTAALFAIAKTWKQSKFPLMDEWIWKMWHTHNRPKLSHKKEGSPCHLHQHEDGP